ncbi:MAG: carboxypeptidase regulatory-like domain-containing protein [Planctomycetes bacterium]|nr:carboxypeptidase regulatory-like domain-containing protein [Planctomycetota bacterium]
MPAHRILGVLVLLFVAAGAALWFWSGDRAPIDLPVAAAPSGAADAEVAATADGAGSDPAAAGAADATTRVEAAVAAPGTGPGPALVGQVVDDRGQPVADASVREASGYDFAAEGFDVFEDWTDDPEAAMARVRTPRPEGAATVTAADGRFRLPLAAGKGRVTLRVAARGFRVLEQRVARPADADVDVGALALVRGAIVTGRVVDRAGNGIAEAAVGRLPVNETPDWAEGMDLDAMDFEGMPGGGRGVTTDAEGRFELPHVPTGDFRLRAVHDDHPSARSDVLQAAAGATLRDVLLVLEPGAVIRGRVIGAPATAKDLKVRVARRRAPPAGGEATNPFGAMIDTEAIADLSGAAERTVDVAADGAFAVRGLRIGADYRVWATEGGAQRFFGGAVCSQRLDVSTPMEGLELRYDPGIRVTFQVVHADTGAPVESLFVQHSLQGGGMADFFGAAMRRGARARHYADGRVTIGDLRPKDGQALRLEVEAIGYRSFERKDIALPSSGDLDLGVVRLAPAPVVRVMVVDAATSAPVAKANVRLERIEGERATGVRAEFSFGGMPAGMAAGAATARTDAEGRCQLNAPLDAPFRLVATHGSYARHTSGELRLSAAGSDYTAALSVGGTVEVTVVDAAGKPVAGERVQRRGADSPWDSETTAETGVATFARLAPGEHRFRLAERGSGMIEVALDAARNGEDAPAAGWEAVAVADGARAELRLVRPAGAELRGVVRENGVPLAGARISFLSGRAQGTAGDLAGMMAEFGGGGDGRSARVADDGAYQLRNLPEGEHQLRITIKSRSMPALVPIVLQPGANVVDVDLDVAVVRGVVRGPDGQPLEGASVRITPVRAEGAEVDQALGAVQGMFQGSPLGGGRSAKTDAEGRFELRGVQTGMPLQVHASARKHAPAASAPFTIDAGSTRDGVDLQLATAGRVRVTASIKVPFTAAMAQRLGGDGQPDRAVAPVVQVLNGGKGTLDGLGAGRWRVQLQVPNGDAPPPQDVAVVAGETIDVTF